MYMLACVCIFILQVLPASIPGCDAPGYSAAFLQVTAASNRWKGLHVGNCEGLAKMQGHGVNK